MNNHAYTLIQVQLQHTQTQKKLPQSLLSLFCLAESLNDIWIFMQTDLLADWFQQPYVHVEMKSGNFLLGSRSLLQNVLIT